MRIRIDDFDWDEHNLEHAEGHGVSAEEIEEVIANQEGRTTYRAHPHVAGRIFAFGRTGGGRWVTTLFAYDRETRTARPITAWDMKPGERTKYAR